MIIRNKIFIGFCFMLLVMLEASSCKPQLTDDAIPYEAFGTIYVNINLPQYNLPGHPGLKSDGGFAYYDDAGVKGLIIYRENALTYHVYERNCSYKPTDACATVNVHVSTLFMEDPCCNSHFEFLTGNPVSGAAWRPLRKYFSSANVTNLTITDEILQ
jgi:hypothetical protein